jgi:dUTP pyrophosphatase
MPAYKTDGAAGMDLASVETGTIPPFTTKRFRTGLKIEIPSGYRGEMHERSSAYTAGLIVRGVIDEDYRGELEIAAYNGNPYPVQVANDGRPYA